MVLAITTIILRVINVILASFCCIGFAFYISEFIKEIKKDDSKRI